MPNLTPKDIAKPGTISGYRNVLFDNGQRVDGHGGSSGAYQADLRRLPQNNTGRSYGPRRATAQEAAQDWCETANGLGVATPPALNTAGHNGKRDSLPRTEDVAEALGILRDAKALRAGRPAFVYLITDGELVKIGHSCKPDARVGELQSGNGRPLSLLGTIGPIHNYVEKETELHQKYIDRNTLGEWFRPTFELLSEF